MKQIIFSLKSYLFQLSYKPCNLFFSSKLYSPLFHMESNLLPSLKRKFSELSENQNSDKKSDAEKSPQSKTSEKGHQNDDEARKVCLQGLDTFSDEKKFLKFYKATFPEDIKIEGLIKKKGKNFAFISFETLDDKARFEQFMNDKKPCIKNKKLIVKPAKTTSFLSFKKLHVLENQIEKYANRIIIPKQEDIDNELKTSIQQRVCPHWETPYSEQIESKKQALLKILKLINITAKKNMKMGDIEPKWLEKESCCGLESFIASDNNETNSIFNYRNKAELTIGKNFEGNINVGFNRGNFNKGIMWVEEAKDCPIISKEAIELSLALQEFIRNKTENTFSVFDRFLHKGFWRNLVVRQSNNTKEIMISVVVCDKDIEKTALDQLKKELQELFFKVTMPNGHKIMGILMLFHNDVSDNIPYNCKSDIIYGVNHYNETILSKSFQISPDSFLQINIPQCEKLYTLIGELANIDDNTIFLDICSGIGTIGICLASKAKQIIAIEVVESACQDSLKNAQNNAITNFTYHCAKVEDIIEEAVKPFVGQNKIVGILDPPRAGLHGNVIKKLRTCKGLDKLIYVSCNPTAMVDNLMGLCLPMNKNRKGPAFTPVKCYGVDLFPLTDHYECVMVLERLYDV